MLITAKDVEVLPLLLIEAAGQQAGLGVLVLPTVADVVVGGIPGVSLKIGFDGAQQRRRSSRKRCSLS